MPTIRSMRKGAEEEPSSSTKPSNLNLAHSEQNAFRMMDPENNWPSYNIDQAEGREALLERIFSGNKERLDSMHEGIKQWTWDWVQPDPKGLSDDQKCRIISELEGVCLQEDWNTLQIELSQCVRRHFGQIVAQAMIYKLIFATFYENPFWVLDGKMSFEDSNDVDPSFARAMEHLYSRFFVRDFQLATLWRMQLFRLLRNGLATKDITSTGDNCLPPWCRARFAPCRKLAEELLGSEPFRWLLLDETNSWLVEGRIKQLSRAIGFAATVICAAEGSYGGHTSFHRLAHLEAAYNQESCDSASHMKPHEFNVGFDEEIDLEGRRLVLVDRPAVSNILSPFRKWLVQDNEDRQFICPAIVLTGRVVLVSERGLKMQDDDDWSSDDDASGSEDFEGKGQGE